MILTDIFRVVEPELTHLRQDFTFVGNNVVENDIETTDTIGGNHDEAIAVVVDLSDLTFFNWFHCFVSFILV
jgi:hypothetical protein